MKRSLYINTLPHILLWGIVVIVPLYMMSRDATPDYGPYMDFFLRIVILAVLFYANYLYLIDKFLFQKKWTAYFLINIAFIVILLVLQAFLSDLFKPQPPLPALSNNMPPPFERGPLERGRPPYFPLRMVTDYLLIIFVIGMSVAMKATFRWYHDSINFEKIKSVQLEADLKNLRNQLNPHFLFNTLNNIYALIALDVGKAQEAVHRLSGLLRYMLYAEDRKFVPMDRELDFMRNFIDLMKLRIGSNVTLDVSIKDHKSKDPIASLLFVTLVENAFKHGISSSKDCFIKIRIVIESGKSALCVVENSISEENITNRIDESGIGLNNLQKRLQLLYPDRHELLTEARGNTFFAHLKVYF